MMHGVSHVKLRVHIGVNIPALRHAKLALSHDAVQIIMEPWEYRYCRLCNAKPQHHAQSRNFQDCAYEICMH